MSGQAGRGSFSRLAFGRLGIMAVLGFSSGLPWALSGPTLRYWMSGEHVPLGMIGLTANIGLAYLLKFVLSLIHI